MGNLNVWKPLLSFFGFPNLPEANTVFQGGVLLSLAFYGIH